MSRMIVRETHRQKLNIVPPLALKGRQLLKQKSSSSGAFPSPRFPMLLLALLLSVLSFPGAGQARADEADYQWFVLSGNARITGYTGPGGAVEIPATLGGNPVGSIGGAAFRDNTDVTSVVIPDSVTNIMFGAFWGCTSLTSVTIPNSIASIGDSAFASCTSLENVTIPDSVTSIGNSAFVSCTSLESVTIGNGVSTIGDSAFWNCTSLVNATIGNSVTNIGEWAFSDCSSLESVIIPDSVTSIGNSAFSGCTSLIRVTIGNGVTRISDNTFRNGSSLTGVTIGNSVTSIVNSAFSDCTALRVVYFEGNAPATSGTTLRHAQSAIAYYRDGTTGWGSTYGGIPTAVWSWYPAYHTDLFYQYMEDGEGDATITEYTGPGGALEIPAVRDGFSVVAIGNGAFSSHPGIASVVMPDSVTDIGWSAFNGCTALASVDIGNSVTNIGNYAFRDCTSLTDIIIPESVIRVGGNAFLGCSSLETIDVESGNPEYSSLNGVLFNKDQTILVRYPEGKADEFYNIPDGVASIGDSSFARCKLLQSVTIPDSVNSIGHVAFERCRALVSVTIGAEVTHIGMNAFRSCSSLESVIIPDSVTWIGGGAFNLCSALESVTIGAGVNNIDGLVFTGCGSLESIEVAPINEDYSSLDGVLFDKDQTTLLRYPAAKAVDSYTIPNSVTIIGRKAFEQCTLLESVMIGNSVTNIGGSAFYGCTSLASVTIPSSVTSIDTFTFAYCTSLASVTIPASVTNIGSSAFSDCSALLAVYGKGHAPELEASLGWLRHFENINYAKVYYKSGTTDWGDTYGGLPTAEWTSYPDPMSLAQAQMPVFDPDGGAHPGFSVDVTITSATEGADIRYTVPTWLSPDGEPPTATSWLVPSSGIVQVQLPGTLRAQVWKRGMAPSEVKVAEFTLAGSDYSIVYLASHGGVIAGESSQTVEHGQDGSEVYADADAGAVFTHWSDGSVANPRVDENVQADITVTAYFASEGGVDVGWYEDRGIVPGEGETWANVDQRYDEDKRMTLAEQYIADLDPAVPTDVFVIEEMPSDTELTFNFHSSVNRVYTLEATSDLMDEQSWEPVPGAGPRVGVGGPDSFTDANETPTGTNYRLTVALPEPE